MGISTRRDITLSCTVVSRRRFPSSPGTRVVYACTAAGAGLTSLSSCKLALWATFPVFITPIPMAEKSAAVPKSNAPQDPFRAYEEKFVASPDPWAELVKLDHGSDRTFGSTIRSMVMNAEPAQRPAMESRLLQVLAKPGITDLGRMFVCRMLALIGTSACVGAVVPLLGDSKTADAGRFALDTIADPAVDAAYRAALDKLAGAAKAGLVGSIALRGDRKALPQLQALAAQASESPDVRTAAKRAVERLNPQA